MLKRRQAVIANELCCLLAHVQPAHASAQRFTVKDSDCSPTREPRESTREFAVFVVCSGCLLRTARSKLGPRSVIPLSPHGIYRQDSGVLPGRRPRAGVATPWAGPRSLRILISSATYAIGIQSTPSSAPSSPCSRGLGMDCGYETAVPLKLYYGAKHEKRRST